MSLLAALVAGVAAGSATGAPVLVSGTGPACVQALAIARAADQSTAFLPSPRTRPATLRDQLVLGPAYEDISGGDALQADERVFEKRPAETSSGTRNLYLHRPTGGSARLAILEIAMGWRGDHYEAFLFPAAMDPGAFKPQDAREGRPAVERVWGPGWQPPFIFQSAGSDVLWWLDPGPPYGRLEDWQVFMQEGGRFTRTCLIRWRPPGEDTARLLPAGVRRLAALLDSTMGSGADEGTLQPTARLRMTAAQAWMNAVYRPWAMGHPYNTVEEVRTALQAWAKSGAAEARVLRAIERRRPQAQTELAGLYRRRFDLGDAEARLQARRVIDVAMRHHYVFTSEATDKLDRDTTAGQPPWPGSAGR